MSDLGLNQYDLDKRFNIISFGITPSISVGPALDYLFIVFGSPVGSYFKDGIKPLHLIISNEFHRAFGF